MALYQKTVYWREGAIKDTRILSRTIDTIIQDFWLSDISYERLAGALLTNIARQPRPAKSRKPLDETGEGGYKLLVMPGHLSFRHPDVHLEITPFEMDKWRYIIGGKEIDEWPETKLSQLGWEVYEEKEH